jgi:hypothetical protein
MRLQLVSSTRRILGIGGFVSLIAVMGATSPRAAVAAGCIGDCDGDGEVTVDEIVLGVNIALSSAALSTCPVFDANGDGEVTVEEIIVAVNNALTSCPVMPTATSTPRPSATSTVTPIPTIPIPTNTPRPTLTLAPTFTPTSTRQPSPTNTPTVIPSSTQTPTVVEASTPTQTAVPTNTVTVPLITIGQTIGSAGAEVTVPISLQSNGLSIVTVAPLVFTYDPVALTFESCSKADGVGAGKSLTTNSQTAGEVRMVLAGDLTVLPDAEILECRFVIAIGASGEIAVPFVSAAVADTEFNDYDATGVSGTITVASAASPTATVPEATATPTEEVPPAPTHTVALATETPTEIVPETPTEVVPPTPTDTPAAPATPTEVTPPTPTATIPTALGPQVTIGNTSGAPGAEVTVPISFQSGGLSIVTIAPLVFGYDSAALTFGSCSKAAAVSGGKSLTSNTLTPGQVRMVLAGDLSILPDAAILECKFTIKVGATGETALSFISAAIADNEFNDYDATGISGSIQVQ